VGTDVKKMKYTIVILSALFLYGCNQNIELVSNGETLSSSAKPSVDPNARPLARADGAAPMAGMGDGPPPFVKAYFMHNFVEALYSTPKNFNPNPKWESPLKDPEKGRVWCTDCHVNTNIDFSRIPFDRTPMVDQWEKNKVFMAGLMKKWVTRLNSDEFGAKGKLKKEVTCLTCHETNPAAGLSGN